MFSEARIGGLIWLNTRGTPEFVAVERPGLVIGRADGADFALSSSQVSRQHLRISWNGPLLIAEDLGSRNGTFLQGRLLTRELLRHGDLLRVGDKCAVVWEGLAPPDATFSERFKGLWGGATLAAALAHLPSAARSRAPVVVQGMTGTGKEATAQAIHSVSGVSGPLVAVNCATLTEALADAQLYGHRR